MSEGERKPEANKKFTGNDTAPPVRPTRPAPVFVLPDDDWKPPTGPKRRLLVAGAIALAALLLLLWIGEDVSRSGAAPGGENWPALEKLSLDTRIVVVLDAGHGGFDPGAVGGNGTIAEATVNQEMVDRVMEQLQRHPEELLVVQAHEAGTYATPISRTSKAVELEADLLLSLHLNADHGPYSRGFQSYPAPPGRVHNEESERFCRLLAQRVRAIDGLPILGDDGIFYAYYRRLSGGGYVKELVDSSQPGARQPREDESFAVVEYPGCPAVLVEQWFLSSWQDMALMYTEDGMDAMADALYLAVCDYFGLAPVGVAA